MLVFRGVKNAGLKAGATIDEAITRPEFLPDL